eukprot:CAMPEP_0114248354 /NCGR_PEP_ID=MMETSP0058-20121206/13529_1 /TAXON_ID=36894 /ORGANISM="Pyramimonas parkeae, CCMP726" /LENGTH=165 /DNA_ID=CAMNT_0001361757 /DNA_START=268 /DNA_END=762 /DNA_ORIENTATION=+
MVKYLPVLDEDGVFEGGYKNVLCQISQHAYRGSRLRRKLIESMRQKCLSEAKKEFYQCMCLRGATRKDGANLQDIPAWENNHSSADTSSTRKCEMFRDQPVKPSDSQCESSPRSILTAPKASLKSMEEAMKAKLAGASTVSKSSRKYETNRQFASRWLASIGRRG